MVIANCSTGRTNLSSSTALIVAALILFLGIVILDTDYALCQCQNDGGVSTVPGEINYPAKWIPPVQLTSVAPYPHGNSTKCVLLCHETIVNVLNYEVNEVSDNNDSGWNLNYWSTKTSPSIIIGKPACDGYTGSEYATYCIVQIYPRSVEVQKAIRVVK